MAKKITAAKKITEKFKKGKNDQMMEKITDVFHSAADELTEVVSKAKKEYDKLDKKTSHKLLAGILGATVLLAGTISMKKLQDRKKKNSI